MNSYWEESVEIALNDVGIKATREQIECIAGAMEVCHENYGMAHGHASIPNPLEAEIEALERREKRREEYLNKYAPCPKCATTGQGVDSWGRDTTCSNCDGVGRVTQHGSPAPHLAG